MIRRDNERICAAERGRQMLSYPGSAAPQEGCWAHLVNPSWWSRAALSALPHTFPNTFPTCLTRPPRPVNESQGEASYSPRAGMVHSVDSRLESSGQHGAQSFYKPGRHLATREATHRPPALKPCRRAARTPFRRGLQPSRTRSRLTAAAVCVVHC
ncbi:hypothetical protein E2C01_064072 [Portunus trituberculatus]|uniref:Uncharacterized protein n=1 Tax=Portunus trituberculatus TaxID=210409 RepID=A0A5B7HAR8_PORTR|nr:hypothetical protein [Portunus trituberculatus]